MDRLLSALPPEERNAIGMKTPSNPRVMLEALDCALDILEFSRERQRTGNLARPQAFPPCHPERNQSGEREKMQTAFPRDEPMHTKLDLAPPQTVSKSWLAGCTLHKTDPPRTPTLQVEEDGRPFTALLDSGSTVTLAHSHDQSG